MHPMTPLRGVACCRRLALQRRFPLSLSTRKLSTTSHSLSARLRPQQKQQQQRDGADGRRRGAGELVVSGHSAFSGANGGLCNPRLRLTSSSALCSLPISLSQPTLHQPRYFYTSSPRLKDEKDNKSKTGKATSEKLKEKNAIDEINKNEIEVPEPIPASAAKNTILGKSTGAGNKSSESTTPPSAAGAAGASGGSSDGGNGGRKRSPKASSEKALAKPSVPEFYPQVMAIPITKRPLFPGFYKAITIKNPEVTAAIFEMIKRGQPYVGAFLLKDDSTDKDVIDNLDEVHEVGTFCQVTSAFDIKGDEPSLTAVLYPHRRIRLTGLVPPDRTAGEKFPRAVLEELEVEEVSSSEAESVNNAINKAKKDSTSEAVVEERAELPEVTVEPARKPAETKSTDRSKKVKNDGEDEVSKEKDGKEGKSPKYEPTSFLKDYKVSLVHVDNLAEEKQQPSSATTRALVSEIVSVFREIAQLNSHYREQIANFTVSHGPGNVADDPAKLADFTAAVTFGDSAELQDVLETLDMEERLHKALLLVKKELMNAQLQSKISKDVENKIQKRQREYWLMEQLKGIKRELGMESDGKEKLVEGFKEKAGQLMMPDSVQKVFDEELNKLQHLEPAASEFNVTRNYLDWLTQIPWGKRSEENFGIPRARRILDEDHYGLKDVKDRILEFIAVGKLRGSVEGKILCMVGPPGVGKTSIGKSIARALNREYYRFSVGGLTDVAEIKGHRRTYVGALPGRIIQALKKCQTENPLVLIDEIDKIGRGHQGDPASALLELLDPEQNGSFLDHYLDVPVDLSKVLFVCTANMTDTIPRPLLDRMELIELSGYVTDEKMAIAERYLAPQAKETSGLADANVEIEKATLLELINRYCRESGVRNLKKQIEKVYRKAALEIVKDLDSDTREGEAEAANDRGKSEKKILIEKKETEVNENEDKSSKTHSSNGKAGKQFQKQEIPKFAIPDNVQVRITPESLKDYIGPPIFTSDRMYDTTPAGVAMGLAWTQMGGAALYVEAILQSALRPTSRPSIEQTGNLKTVMRESTAIAYSYAKSYIARHFPENEFFDHAKIHLHFPEGAVPKDGPSAGITMTSALLSLALDTPLRPDLAMTGELTLTGKVLRIGGLREKTVAAKRAGVKKIIFPADNWKDWEELPENIREGIEGVPVREFGQVFEQVFGGEEGEGVTERSVIDKEKGNNVWKETLKRGKKNDGMKGKQEEKEDDDEK